MTEADFRFLEYARRKTYFLRDPQEKSEEFVQSAEELHPLCADRLCMLMCQDEIKKTRLYHCGEYCALAHASAELLCELFQSMHLYSFKRLFHHIIDTDTRSLCWDDFLDNDSVSVLREALDKKMSETRSRCFFLAWKAVAQLNLV